MLLQNRNRHLEVNHVFNMENLSVGFASLNHDGTIDRAATTNAISQLAEIIWKKGGFRFWHAKTNWQEHAYTYISVLRMPSALARRLVKENAIPHE